MKQRTEHSIPVAPQDYFDKVFANVAFQAETAKLVNLKKREILKEEDLGDQFYREVLQVPNRELPAVIKKIAGGVELSYVDRSTYDKKAHRLSMHITPSVKPDKIAISAELWLEPEGSGSRRVCEIEVDVNIFGVGRLIEKSIIKDVVSAQERQAGLICDYYGS